MNQLFPQELIRRLSTDSKRTSESRGSSQTPDRRRFRELLKADPVDENLREKDLFKLIEEKEQEDALEGIPTLPPFLPSLVSNPKEESINAAIPVNTPLPFTSLSSDASSTSCISSVLSAEAHALFEKMASTMIVMQTSGETETTLFLDSPQFSSSVFFGAQITIREFSTAPKAFNVEIIASSLAIQAMNSCRNDLLSAFQNGRFNFSVHRFDTFLLAEERPLFHRKEEKDGNDGERSGDRQ